MSINGKSVLIVAVMRNEGPYILEWLAHHFSIGFDELLIFTNDCDDNTDHILDRLEELLPGKVKHQPNPKIMFRDRGVWHIMALRYAASFGKYQKATWRYATDADEFLFLKTPEQTLDSLLEATGETDVISFTSIGFNSSNQKRLNSQLTTDRFTSMSRNYDQVPDNGKPMISAVKTLFRGSIQGAWRPHRPVTPEFSKTGQRWINGSAEVMPASFTDGSYKGIDPQPTRKFAQMHHYAIKSAEAFLIKVDRGDAVDPARLGRSQGYWANYNQLGAEETCACHHNQAFKDLYEYFLSDRQLRELHEMSLQIHKDKVARILKTPAGETLAREIGYFEK
jgi:hypothetical protein